MDNPTIRGTSCWPHVGHTHHRTLWYTCVMHQNPLCCISANKRNGECCSDSNSHVRRCGVCHGDFCKNHGLVLTVPGMKYLRSFECCSCNRKSHDLVHNARRGGDWAWTWVFAVAGLLLFLANGWMTTGAGRIV